MIAEISEKVDKIFDDILETASDLIKIPSRNPPGEERKCSEYIASRLREMNLDIHVINEPFMNRPQIIAYSDERRDILLNGHMDTVPEGDRELWSIDPFSGIIRDGMLYGRGAVDMKSALAMMIHIPRIIRKGLILTFAVGEERAEAGTKEMMKYVKARYGIVLEPTSLAVAPYQRGAAWYRITVRGKATHASMPEKGVNAIDKASKVMHRINEYSSSLIKSDMIHPTCTITMINSGLKENIIPDRCDLTIDRRLIPGEKSSIVENEIRELLKDQTQEITLIGSREAVEISPSSLISKTLLEFTGKITGKAQIICFPGATDNEHLVSNGIESLVWGPGDLSRAHAVDECIDINEIRQASKILALTLANLDSF